MAGPAPFQVAIRRSELGQVAGGRSHRDVRGRLIVAGREFDAYVAQLRRHSFWPVPAIEPARSPLLTYEPARVHPHWRAPTVFGVACLNAGMRIKRD